MAIAGGHLKIEERRKMKQGTQNLPRVNFKVSLANRIYNLAIQSYDSIEMLG